MNDKSENIYGLDKVPDDAVIKSQANEIADLTKQIECLECYKRGYYAIKEAIHKSTTPSMKREFLKSFKATELATEYRNKIEHLEAKNKSLKKSNEELIMKIIQLNNKI